MTYRNWLIEKILEKTNMFDKDELLEACDGDLNNIYSFLECEAWDLLNEYYGR